MSTILTILGMLIIGSIIVVFTNFVAIKMLFHPYYEKKIFGYKISMHQVIISKTRNELSEKGGHIVTKHLLTTEVYKEKLDNPNTKSVLEDTIKVQFKRLKEKNYTPEDFINRFDYPLE